MAKNSGFAFKTSLKKIDIIDGPAGSSGEQKPLLAITLGGKQEDLIDAQTYIMELFPDAKIQKKAHKLRVLVPMSGDIDAPSATDMVEQVVDLIHCDIDYQFTLASKHHGTKHVPELNLSLKEDHPSHSLTGKVVMDLIERKMDPSKTSDPLTDYTYERTPNGNGLVIRPNNEVFSSMEQALLYGMVMASHFKHRLDPAAHNLRMTGMEIGTIENPRQEIEEGEEWKQNAEESTHKQGVTIVLTGNHEELLIAKRSFNKKSLLSTDINPPEDGQTQHTMRISGAAETLTEVCSMIREVHLTTGCKLPVEMAKAFFSNNTKLSPSAPAIPVYKPAVALAFNTPETHYNKLMVDALASYIAGYMKMNGSIHIPMTYDIATGQNLYDLRSPSAIISEQSYANLEDAQAHAEKMFKRVRSMIEFDPPAKDSRGM
jgi:hypothetical protein